MPCARSAAGFRPLGLALLLACGGGGGSDLAVNLRTDYQAPVDFSELRVTLQGGDGINVETLPASLSDYVRGVFITRFDDLAHGEYVVRAELLDEAGTVIGSRANALTLRQPTSVTLVITQSCRDVRCPGDGNPNLTECSDGRCVAPECSPETPELCEGGCTSDAECPASVACATGVCLSDGACLSVPDDARCADSERCDARLGCRTRPDASVADMSAPDTGAPDMGAPDMGATDLRAPDATTTPDAAPEDDRMPDEGTDVAVDEGCTSNECEPGERETRMRTGTCVSYEQTRVCSSMCAFGAWTGSDPSVQCTFGATRLCPGEEIELPCDASGNERTQVCNAGGVLVNSSVVYGCTVRLEPGAGTRICPGQTFTRSCFGIPGGRARIDYRCEGTSSPAGGTFTTVDLDYCTATSGAEAGMNFCPGEVIRRDGCPGSRSYFICPETAGSGTGFVREATLSCTIEADEWEPLHRGVDLRRWTEAGARFRALRIDLCDASLRIGATAEADRGARTSTWASANNMLAAISGGFFRSGSYQPDACVAFGEGDEWSGSLDGSARSFIAFGRENVFYSEAPNIDRAPYPGFEWMEEAVCGDATIVRDGRAVGTSTGPAAERTVAGFSTDRRTLYLLTVDSPGRTVAQMGPPLAALGADFGINLGGGASTTMWANGLGAVSRGGAERVIGNHLGVYIEGGARGYNCPP
ncbi:MAG: phosphodiester glycosidase family protein [Myxococcota bacterium]